MLFVILDSVSFTFDHFDMARGEWKKVEKKMKNEFDDDDDGDNGDVIWAIQDNNKKSC